MAASGREPGATFDDYRRVAELALRQLLADRAVGLVLLNWPSQDPNGDVDVEALQESDWDDPVAEEPYVALARN